MGESAATRRAFGYVCSLVNTDRTKKKTRLCSALTCSMGGCAQDSGIKMIQNHEPLDIFFFRGARIMDQDSILLCCSCEGWTEEGMLFQHYCKVTRSIMMYNPQNVQRRNLLMAVRCMRDYRNKRTRNKKSGKSNTNSVSLKIMSAYIRKVSIFAGLDTVTNIQLALATKTSVEVPKLSLGLYWNINLQAGNATRYVFLPISSPALSDDYYDQYFFQKAGVLTNSSGSWGLAAHSTRGGEWYPENCGSRKILARSWNLGNVYTESRSLFFSCLVQKSLESRQVSDFTIRHPQHMSPLWAPGSKGLIAPCWGEVHVIIPPLLHDWSGFRDP